MFIDRRDAAEKLAEALEKYRDTNAIVLGIPRGGVETAYYVARALDADLSIVITRKLGYPGNPETAFGAIAEDGSVYLSPYAEIDLSKAEINEIIEEQKEEIKRRVKLLRKGQPLPNLKDRTVIIVDDGVATGATLLATIELCRKKGTRQLVVAAPVGSIETRNALMQLVDDVVILLSPPHIHAVSQGYEEFYNLSDEQAVQFLEKWERETSYYHK